jgi:hypothetical protein
MQQQLRASPPLVHLADWYRDICKDKSGKTTVIIIPYKHHTKESGSSHPFAMIPFDSRTLTAEKCCRDNGAEAPLAILECRDPDKFPLESMPEWQEFCRKHLSDVVDAARS